MKTEKQVEEYINSQPGSKRSDMQAVHQLILRIMPGSKRWFLDGKNEENKTVSNPNIGYGSLTMKYADGSSRLFYQVGLSANTTGISVYIMALPDRKYLPEAFGKKIGKASVSGYCIKFKALKDIDLKVLEEAIRYGVNATGEM